MIEIILGVARAVFVVMFGMNLGVICTWVDRRQGALIQDRVGPDRAVVWLPTMVARALAVLPAAAAAAAVLFLAVQDKQSRGEDPVSMGRAVVFSQLAIFVAWATLAAAVAHVRRRGAESGLDRLLLSLGQPRRIAQLGVLAQVGVICAMALIAGSRAE